MVRMKKIFLGVLSIGLMVFASFGVVNANTIWSQLAPVATSHFPIYPSNNFYGYGQHGYKEISAKVFAEQQPVFYVKASPEALTNSRNPFL